MDKKNSYTAVIRTLGKAGDKYQTLLDSLCSQTIQPKNIIVYIAEGYAIPKETCGKEEYVYVAKGMVAQRAISYKEVSTKYILFLDDDLYLPNDFVENMFKAMNEYKADVVSPDIYDNASRNLLSEILMTISGRMRARRGDDIWGYRVMRTCGYSYNKKPETGRSYFSQTNAGACFLCSKENFQSIKLKEELWLDKMEYSIGDDQVMFYKMYLMGLKQITLFGSGIKHLDAGLNLGNKEKEKKLINGDYYFRMIFWHRFIQSPETNWLKRIWNKCCISYFIYFGYMISLLKGETEFFNIKRKAVSDAKVFLNTKNYRNLPIIKKIV